MITKNIFVAIIFSASLQIPSYAQSRTNFDIIDSLLDASVEQIVEKIDKNDIYFLNFVGSDDYIILAERLKQNLQKHGVNLIDNSKVSSVINYGLNEARTEYEELFQDGIFGEYLVKRSVFIDHSFYLGSQSVNSVSNDYSYSFVDTVLYSDLSRLENIAYTFASDEIPEEPLFSSTLEPIIAVGTAAVAVYLFFNIRSK